MICALDPGRAQKFRTFALEHRVRPSGLGLAKTAVAMTATKPQILGIPGTGLPLGLFGAIVAVSVALFVVWGGCLWAAPREASHLARFTVSYLVVVPLAALALLAVHRWSWPHLLAAVATIWCIKLVLTALLYLALARGTAVHLEPVPLAPRATAPERPETTYHAAAGAGPHGALAGRVTLSGQPLVGSIAYLAAPHPGAPSAPGGRWIWWSSRRATTGRSPWPSSATWCTCTAATVSSTPCTCARSSTRGNARSATSRCGRAG
jgi:hypothetical protein